MSRPCEERSLLNEILPFLKREYEIQIALSAAKGVSGKEMRMLHQTEADSIRKLSDKLNMSQNDTKKKAMETLYLSMGVFFI